MWKGKKEGVRNFGAAGADFQTQCSPRPVHHDNEPQIELGRWSGCGGLGEPSYLSLGVPATLVLGSDKVHGPLSGEGRDTYCDFSWEGGQLMPHPPEIIKGGKCGLFY